MEKTVRIACQGSTGSVDGSVYGYAIEIEPKYCDVIVERWQNLTGQKAKRIKSQ